MIEMEVRRVSLNDIQLCDELYPRQNVNHIHVLRLRDALQVGANLPPLLCDQNLRLIDGRHRYEAYRQLKRTEVDVQIVPVASDAEFFCKAVEANIAHGRPFSPYDMTCIALRLHGDFQYDPNTIAQLLRLPSQRLEDWLKRRVAVAPSLYKVPLKASFLHYADKTIPLEVEAINRRSRGLRWVQALDELRRQLMDSALRASLIDFLREEPKFQELLQSFAETLLNIVQASRKATKKKGQKQRQRRG